MIPLKPYPNCSIIMLPGKANLDKLVQLAHITLRQSGGWSRTRSGL